MLRISFTIFLAFTAWIHPALVVSAFAEPPQENPQFINYEKFHEQLIPQTIKLLSVKKTTAKPNDFSSYSGRNYSKTEVIELIENYSREYRIESNTPLCIAKLESGYNQFSKNKSSSASGVFQYLSGTWKSTDEGRIGQNVFDADSNVKAAIKYMASRKNAKPWTVASKCPPIKSIN